MLQFIPHLNGEPSIPAMGDSPTALPSAQAFFQGQGSTFLQGSSTFGLSASQLGLPPSSSAQLASVIAETLDGASLFAPEEYSNSLLAFADSLPISALDSLFMPSNSIEAYD